uniref:Uncharacterized protein n=1 Tax=Urostyla grandis TaxID=57509 RepID=A0A2I4PFN2_9SPIT|nr:hypothetical protein [Urostyla grandis]
MYVKTLVILFNLLFKKWNLHRLSPNINFHQSPASRLSQLRRLKTLIYNWKIIYYPLPPRPITPFIWIWSKMFFELKIGKSAWQSYRLALMLILERLLTLRAYVIDDGIIFFRGLIIIFGLDGLLSDDEPLWEPIEWSLVQTWLLFIFLFAWIGENLIASRYGSYVGRDKRVWFAWYKSFWLIEAWYLISYGAASLFVIVPFYYEITYSIAFLVSWWDWYTRVFVFKFVSILFLLLFLGTWVSINVRWIGWHKLFAVLVAITLVLIYLFFSSFLQRYLPTSPIPFDTKKRVSMILFKWAMNRINGDEEIQNGITSLITVWVQYFDLKMMDRLREPF